MKEQVVIVQQKDGSLNAEDRLELSKILIKAGYTVAIEKRKVGKATKYVVVGYIQEG